MSFGVRLIGRFSQAERVALFAHALAIVFPSFDEDLGYVPMEAMYAGKPVVTCTDSGGPLEFVVHGETGEIAEPTPQAVADAIDRLAADPARARRMGEAGRELFFVFADGTSGHGSYPAGRFLEAAWPEADGKVVLDFNRAYNPPCAFTLFATCPLPPAGNRLDLAIDAGEKNYKLPVQ